MQTNQFNTSEQLGHLIGEFGWNKGRAKFVLGIWIFIFICSLPFSFVLLGLPGLILSIIFIRRSLQRLRGAEPIVLLYQRGLVDRRQKGSDVVRYEEIKNLLLAVVRTNGVLNYLITLETQAGRKIKIDEHVEQTDRLRSLLEEQVIQAQLPAMIDTYHQGTAIAFGRLTLTQTGLSVGKRMLPWSEFASVDVEKSGNFVDLVIRQQGSKNSWFAESRNSFPNLALFFTLVNYITASHT